jgi:DNA-binding response OmpR family regulator
MDTKVLLVLPPHRQSRLLKLLDGREFQVFSAFSVHEAQEKLATGDHYDLLLVDAELPDGSWRDLLQSLLEPGKTCEIIVCSRQGDEQLWAEVLQCGGYDLLVEPYDQREVNRIIGSALNSQYMRRFSQMAMLQAS